jgi:hypothetical protein
MNNQYSLGDANTAHIYALSQQGNSTLSHEALIQQATAQAAMRDMQTEKNLEVPKVNFYPSRHPDPHKARKKDIKQAYKLLTPSKRAWYNPLRWIWGRKYRYDKQTSMCVIDGCDCATLIQHDNLYHKIRDEDNNKSLWELYWQNPINGQPEAFTAKEKVTSGRKMRGTYCPEHMHLYHLLCKWEAEEDKIRESNPKRLRDRVKKGVSVVTVPISSITKKDPTPPFLEKYEPFFAELEKDSRKSNGISILHYKNPSTNINDVTMIVFDLRIFQEELNAMNQPTAAFQQMMMGQMTQQKSLEEQPLGVGE